MPIRETAVTVGALRFPVREAGPADGFPVVLLHGFPDCNSSFDLQLEALGAAGYRAIAPGLRGYSPDAIPADGDYFVSTIVGDVVGLLDALGIERAHLVGHDWGAIIGWVAIAAHPRRFVTYTSLAIPPLDGLPGAIRRYPAQLRNSWYIAFFQLRGLADRAFARDDFAFIDRLWRDWSPGWRCPKDSMARIKDTFRRPGVPRAALDFYRHLFFWWAPESRRGRALVRRRIELPCLVVHGRTDGALDARVAAAAVDPGQFAAGVKFELLDAAGHFLHQEQPTKVNALLLDFFAAYANSKESGRF